jgi:hypothetical protein
MCPDELWLPLRQGRDATHSNDQPDRGDARPCLRDELGAPLLLDDLPGPGDLLS